MSVNGQLRTVDDILRRGCRDDPAAQVEIQFFMDEDRFFGMRMVWYFSLGNMTGSQPLSEHFLFSQIHSRVSCPYP